MVGFCSLFDVSFSRKPSPVARVSSTHLHGIGGGIGREFSFVLLKEEKLAFTFFFLYNNYVTI